MNSESDLADAGRPGHQSSGMTDGPPLPEMREGLLSSNDVRQLCSDVLACTRLIAVQEKQRVQSRAAVPTAAADATLLRAAADRLLAGEIRGLQIRYAYEQHEWSDTLIGINNTYRLIRCQHPAMPTGPAGH